MSASNRVKSWSTFCAATVSRISTILSLAMIGFAFVTVALAYYNGDVPEHLALRWKYYPVFVGYFFNSLLAAYASVGFALLAACFKPSRFSFVLLGAALVTVVAHAAWQDHLRH